MLLKRRQFLQSGSLATASFMMPKFLKAFEGQGNLLLPPTDKVVVILQLSGGNDGLNTVIPYRNDIYYRSRPGLGIAKDKLLTLNDDAGLHAALPAFKELYDEGNLAVLNSVGYPNPDRSHFRSMDIWHTASNSNEYLTNGWIGRYLDAQCRGCDQPTQAIEIDDMLSLALKGNNQNSIACKDPERLYNTSRNPFFSEVSNAHSTHHTEEEATVDYLYKTMAETLNSADYIFKQSKLRATQAVYPKTELGNGFKTIGSLIASDINTGVYYISHGSFDTHFNQQFQQQRLFNEMNEAVAAFVKDLKSINRFKDTLLFTFSEFGRRVAQNASGGTDHGTANNMLLISGGLQHQGLINALPNLSDLTDGDLKYQVDFKNVYATVLNKWLKVNDTLILGKQLELLDFI